MLRKNKSSNKYRIVNFVRNNNDNNNPKKEIRKIVLVILLLLSVTIGASYAFLRVTLTSNKNLTLKSGIFNIEFKDSNTISLQNAGPISDSEGLDLVEPYTFSVENIGNVDGKYKIYLEEKEGNNLDKSYVKYSIKKNDGTYSTPRALTDDLILAENVELLNTNKDTYNLKLWVDYNAPNEVQGKEFSAKLVVESVQNTETLTHDDILLTLNGSLVQNIVKNETYVDPGVLSLEENSVSKNTGLVDKKYEYFDGEDLEVVESIDTSKTGIYYIHYTYKNIHKVRVVNVLEQEQSVSASITLKGESQVDVKKNTEYVDSGYTSSDRVVVLGNVNTEVLGTYIIKYVAISETGAMASVTREVNVIEKGSITITNTLNISNNKAKANINITTQDGNLEYYYFTKSNKEPEEVDYQKLKSPTNNYTKEEELEKNGTYYVWAIDSNKNIKSKEVVVTGIDDIKPICTFSELEEIGVGEEKDIELTCTDNVDISEKYLIDTNFNINNSNIEIVDVSAGVKITKGYKYTITLRGKQEGTSKITLPSKTIKDTNDNYNNEVESEEIEVTLAGYTISYNLDGGVANNPETYTTESSDITLNNPTKTGYTFTGWTGSNGNTPEKNVTIPSGSTGNKTYTAHYTPIEYTISYTLNGGSVSTTNPSKYTIESNDITLNNPTKEGYTFTGWTGSNGNVPEENVTIPSGSTGNKTYEANFSINQYTVLYDGEENGGTNTVSESVNYNANIDLTKTETKEGYEFVGWNTNKNATTALSSLKMGTSDVTLYAIFRKIITVNYTKDTGVSEIGATSSSCTAYNKETSCSITLPTIAAEKGYSPSGWYNGTTKVANASASYTLSSNVTLTAKAEANTYTLTFNADGGSVSPTARSVTYGTTYTDLPTPTKAGYTFKGWYADLSSNSYILYGKDYKYSDKISIHTSAYSSNWSSKCMVIFSSTEGGGWDLESTTDSCSTGNVRYTVYDSGVGYKYASSSVPWSSLSSGWHDFDLVFDGNYVYGYLDGTKIATSERFTSGKIGYSNNGIFIGAEAGGNVNTPAGWYFGANIGNIIIKNDSNLISGTTYNTFTAPAQNITLYPRWEPITYSIGYDLAGGIIGEECSQENGICSFTGEKEVCYGENGKYNCKTYTDSVYCSNSEFGDPSMGFVKACYIVDSNKNSYTVETNSFKLNNPVKAGYTFTGWTGSNGTSPETEVTIPKGSTGNKSYTAHWKDDTKPTCSWSGLPTLQTNTTGTATLTCSDYQSGLISKTLTPSDFTTTANGQVTAVSAPTALMNGYEYTVTLKGLSTGTFTASLKAGSISDNATNTNDVATSSNVTVNGLTYTATFTAGSNAAIVDSTAKSCTTTGSNTSCSITLPTITPASGYSEDGWYLGTTKVGNSGDSYALSSNAELTTKANINSYTVSYNAAENGGTTTAAATSVNYNANIDLTKTATKSGYTFVGWNTNKDATTALSSLKMGTSNVVLYAIFRKEAVTYTATFNKNGASEIGATSLSCTIPAVYNNATQDSSCTTTAKAPTITAPSQTPTVVGWNTNKNGTTSTLDVGDGVVLNENKEYYAITTKTQRTNTASFYGNEGTVSSDSVSCTIPATYNGTAQAVTCSITTPTATAPTATPTILGYATSSSATTASIGANTSTSISGGEKYYLITRKDAVTYTATYEKGSNVSAIGATSNSCTIPATYNGTAQATTCSVTTPSITAATGYTASGWYSGSTKIADQEEEYTLSSNITLTAQASVNVIHQDLNYIVDGSWYFGGYGTNRDRIKVGLKINGVDKGYVADFGADYNYGTPYEIYGVQLDGTTLTSYKKSGTITANMLNLTFYTLTLSPNNENYGSVSPTSIIAWPDETYTTSGNKLTMSDGRTATATPTAATGYSTSFSSWSNTSGTFNKALTTTANFTRSANALTFANQSITKTFATTAQTASVTAASNGTGTYTYTEVSEKNSAGTATNYISLSGTTITLAENTPVGVYTYVIRAADSNSGATKDATYTITVNGLTYTATYQKGDNVIEIGSTTASCTTTGTNTSCSVTAPTITAATGYSPSGWYNGTTKVANASASYTLSSNVTLTAKATANSYTLTADANGGSISSTTGWTGTGESSTKPVTYNSTYGTLPTASKNGYDFAGWSYLPDGYKQVEYIQSTGTQYINTGYYWTHENIKIYFDGTVLSNSSYQSLFGNEEYVSSSGNSRNFAGIPHGINGAYGIYIGNSDQGTLNTTIGTRFTLDIETTANKNLFVYVNGTKSSSIASTYSGSVLTQSTAYKSSNTSTTVGNIFLFANHNTERGSSNSAIQNVSSMRVYSFKLFDNGDLVRAFVPCINESTGKAGLYDLVGNKFYGNNGSGDFVAGNESYITSTSKVGLTSKHNIYARWKDTTPPTNFQITNSSGGNWTNKTVAITLNAIDDGSGIGRFQVKYSGNNNSWAYLPGTVTNGTLSDGWSSEMNETIYYRAVDKAGNASEPVSTNIKIDKTKPSCTWSGLPTLQTNGTGTATLTCTDSASGVVSKTLATTDFTTTDNGQVTAVSAPTAVTNGYKYTVTLKGLSTGTFTASLKAGSISDNATNTNDVATSSNVTVNGLTYTATFTAGSNAAIVDSTAKSCTTTGSATSCSITLPTITPASGYSEDGWYNGTTKVGNSGDSYTISGNVSLTTKANINSYTATFNGNGGSNGTSITKNYGDQLGTLPTSSRSGYTFAGWYTSETGGSQISSTTTMPLNGATYYAHWLTNVTIPTAASYCAGVTYNGDSQTITKAAGTGYTFSGHTGKVNAGSYTVTASLSSGYAWSDGSTSNKTFSCSVAQRATTCTSGSTSKTYDGTALTSTNTGSCTNLVSGQSATFSGHKGTITNAGSTANTFGSVVIKSGTTDVSGNYAITKANGTLTVNQAKTATKGSCANPTYDGTSKTLASGGSYVSYSDNSRTNAGSQNVTITTDSNHQFSDGTESTTMSCSVAQRATTCTSGSTSKTYDGTALTSTNTGSCTNLVSGHAATFSSHTGTITNAGSTANTFGSVVIKSGTTDVSGNYAITKANGTLTVNQAKTATKGSCENPTYDGTSKTLASGGSYVTYSDNSKTDAGNQTVTVTTDSNHQFSDGTESTTMSCGVAKRATTCTSGSTSKTYDGSALTSTNTGSCTNLVSGQSATFSGHTGTITNAGSTANTFGSVVIKSGTTDVSGNYSITKENGTLTVDKRTLTVKATAKSKAYGDNNPTLAYTYSGNVSGQTPGFTGNITTSATASSNVGSYDITQGTLALADGTSFAANNYTLAYTKASLTISKRETTCTSGSDSKIYDGTALTSTNTGSCTNLVSGHDATFSGHTGTITNVGTTANTFGSVVIKSGTTDVSGNYAITKANGTLIVEKRALIVKATAKSKTYGDNNPTLAYTYSGNVSGQTPGFTGNITTSATASSDVGSYDITRGTLALADGTSFAVSNYTLGYTKASLTISKRETTCTSGSASKTYDGSALTSTNTGSCTNLVSGQSATFSGHTGTITNAGSTANTFGSVVIKSGTTDVSGNYSITKANGTLTVNKANISPTVSMSGYTFAGTKSTPSVSGNTGGGSVTYYYNTTNSNSGGTAWSTVTNSSSLAVGTYYMYAVVGASTNYNGATTPAVAFTISGITRTATFTANGNSLTTPSGCSASGNNRVCSCTTTGKNTSCSVNTPKISNSTTPNVCGYTTSSTGSTSCSVAHNSTTSLSSSPTYYAQTYLSKSITYSKGNGVDSIGSTGNSCTRYNGAKSCSVTLPTITVSGTEKALGWYSGTTKVGNASASVSISSNDTYYARAVNKYIQQVSQLSSTCITPGGSGCTDITSSVNADTTYTAGTPIAYAVAPTQVTNQPLVKQFNVIKDNGNTLTLLMNSNLGDKVAWYTSADNRQGPHNMEMNFYYAGQGSEPWSYVNDQTYSYGGEQYENSLGFSACSGPNNCGVNKFTRNTVTYKLRALTMQEAFAIGCTSTQTNVCPNWFRQQTDAIEDFWLMSAYSGDNKQAWYYNMGYGSGSLTTALVTAQKGLRPVIEINK